MSNAKNSEKILTESEVVAPYKETGVSAAWVLSQLAGMRFPEPGSAYEYMKRCLKNAAG